MYYLTNLHMFENVLLPMRTINNTLDKIYIQQNMVLDNY